MKNKFTKIIQIRCQKGPDSTCKKFMIQSHQESTTTEKREEIFKFWRALSRGLQVLSALNQKIVLRFITLRFDFYPPPPPTLPPHGHIPILITMFFLAGTCSRKEGTFVSSSNSCEEANFSIRYLGTYRIPYQTFFSLYRQLQVVYFISC